jgi:hypothetical protein
MKKSRRWVETATALYALLSRSLIEGSTTTDPKVIHLVAAETAVPGGVVEHPTQNSILCLR